MPFRLVIIFFGYNHRDMRIPLLSSILIIHLLKVEHNFDIWCFKSFEICYLIVRFLYLIYFSNSTLSYMFWLQHSIITLDYIIYTLCIHILQKPWQAMVTTFNAYCIFFYTVGRCVDFTQKTYSSLHVQYTNGFRMLLGLDDVSAVMQKRSNDVFRHSS